jgi:hypothetical protein
VKDNREVRQVKGKRGGAVKKAPPGYYTAGEAQKVIGMNASTFGYYVRKGKIKKFVPPLRTEGFYEKREIDQLAREMALFLHTDTEEPVSTAKTRIARSEDAPGVVNVLASIGWQTATAEQRLAWYKVNPHTDYIITWKNEIMGYIWAVPFIPETLEDMMSGKKRAWNIQAHDILPYEPGGTYDIYTGIAIRQDITTTGQTTRFAFRLIAGYLAYLEELVQQGIQVHHIYAVSAESNGQKLSRALGFIEQEAKAGDRFPRFVVDLKKSDSHFARQYRKIVSSLHRH